MKKKIKWLEKRNTSIQIYSRGLQYALVSPDYEQSTQFVYCKDFLQDAVQASLVKQRRSMYRFVYDPNQNPSVYTNGLRLLISNAGDPFLRHKIVHCRNFIEQFENVLKIKNSVITECLNPPKKYKESGVWLFEGSKRWIKSPPMLSLYSLLIRVGFVHREETNYYQTLLNVKNGKTEQYQGNDKPQVRFAMKGIDRIIKHGDRRIFHTEILKNYPESISTEIMHEHCGITGFAQGEVKSQFPHWYRGLPPRNKRKLLENKENPFLYSQSQSK